MPKPASASITLHHVAEAAGVSPMTVSRALKTPERVSRETMQRVQRALKQTGYVPNLLAGGLKSRRSLTVGALVPVVSVPQFLPTLQALTEALDRAGYQLILGQTGYDHQREAGLLQTLIARRVDAVVAAGLLRSPGAAQRLRKAGVPLVETWDLGARPADMAVGFSHAEAGAAVARHFAGRGWRRVGIATADDERALARRDGFVAAFGRAVPTAVVPAPSSMERGRRALTELLRQQPRLRAVCCSSDSMAQGVMTEARARGLRVPEDLAVCGFGDADFAAHLEPSLTTVRIDGAEIGRRAAAMVLARCAGHAVEERKVDVGFEIVERASTRAGGAA